MSEGHRLLLLAARSVEELRVQLAIDDQLLLQRDDVQRAPSGGPYRLAIVDADARRLARARRIVEGGTPWRGRSDIWFTASPLLGAGGGSIALIFPGLSSALTQSSTTLPDISAYRAPRSLAVISPCCAVRSRSSRWVDCSTRRCAA